MNLLVVNFWAITVLSLIVWINQPKEKESNILFLLAFTLLVLVHGYASRFVTVDIWEYEERFNSLVSCGLKEAISSINLAFGKEYAFYLSFWLFGRLGISFNMYLYFYSFLFLGLYFNAINKYSQYKFLSIILFLLTIFNQSLYVLRQLMAMAILIYSYKYIIARDLKRFSILLFMAILFHLTAIIFFPIYFLYGIKGRNRLLLVVAFFSILLGILFRYFDVVVQYYFVGYADYLDSDLLINSTRFFINLCYLSCFIFFLKEKVFDDGINRLLFVSLMVAAIGSFCGIGYVQSDRLFMYYSNTAFLSVPIVISNSKGKIVRCIVVLIVMIFNYYLSFHEINLGVLQNINLPF